MQKNSRTLPLILLGLVTIVTALSFCHPHDRLTWYLEAAPVLIAAPVLFFTFKRFPLTPLSYILIALHAVILLVGAHYTYARVPLGDWLAEMCNFSRNHYDRLGHFAQGFVPAIIGREILLRTSPLKPSKWLNFLTVSVCLAISAVYELIEWLTALVSGEAAEAFLGTQGDVWDTQTDMALALIGAITALLLLSRWHNRQLQRFHTS